MKSLMKRFIKDDSGLELVEYALMLGVLIVGVGLTAYLLKDKIQAIWQGSADELDKVAPATT
jgi:Flp pilus assembly pilin Flp